MAGFGEHFWPSLNRTRQFYLDALGPAFELLHLDSATTPDPAAGGSEAGSTLALSGLLNFSGDFAWQLDPHPEQPLIFSMHGGPILSQEFLYRHLGRLESTDVLLVNCTSDQSILRQMFDDATPRLAHLPLPVGSEHFQPRPRAECRRRLPIEPVDHLVGFVGRLLPQKGLHQFLRLLADLRQRLRPRTVGGVVVGTYWMDYPVLPFVTETYPEEIKALIAELELGDSLTYFPARLSDDELASCYGALDVLIHPTSSIDENFGYTALEAMACGTPVVGAAYGGLKDTVIDGETGFLMPTWASRSGIRMDLDHGLDQVCRLLDDDPLRQRFSAAAAQRAHQVFSVPVCAERLRRAIEESAAARHRGEARPLRRRKPPEPATELGLLPPTAIPWEAYSPVVEHYVSGPPPRPSANDRLRLAAPLITLAGGGQRLADPAWPATFQLTTADSESLGQCGRSFTRAQLEQALTAAGAAVENRVQQWLDLGLLLANPADG